MCDLENLKNEVAMTRVGSQRHRKKSSSSSSSSISGGGGGGGVGGVLYFNMTMLKL